MQEFDKTVAVVVNASIMQSVAKNLLIHLHLPNVSGLAKLKRIFSETLKVQVVVTSPKSQADQLSDGHYKTAYDFLPQGLKTGAANHTIVSPDFMPTFRSVVSGRSLKQIEKFVIEEAIASSGGSVPKAAKALKVSPSTLYRKRETWSAA